MGTALGPPNPGDADRAAPGSPGDVVRCGLPSASCAHTGPAGPTMVATDEKQRAIVAECLKLDVTPTRRLSTALQPSCSDHSRRLLPILPSFMMTTKSSSASATRSDLSNGFTVDPNIVVIALSAYLVVTVRRMGRPGAASRIRSPASTTSYPFTSSACTPLPAPSRWRCCRCV